MQRYTEEEQKKIARLFAGKMIARSDVKAIQKSDGSYAPRREAFTMQDIVDHINGKQTYGHYLLNPVNGEFLTKLIVFDIDLTKKGKNQNVIDDCWLPTSYTDGVYGDFVDVASCRDIWRARASSDVERLQRGFMSFQLRMMAEKLMRAVSDHLQVPTTMAYTGSKGVHVYAFTGLVTAEIARAGQEVVMDKLGCFEKKRGNNFYVHKNTGSGPEADFAQMEIEVYPKQESMSEGGFGNLVRLPLGKNMHNPSHPTFFMDARGSIGAKSIHERDAIDALTHDNPWE